MAKWDLDKLDKAIKEAEKKGEDPPVPVTARKMSAEELNRRYEKG